MLYYLAAYLDRAFDFPGAGVFNYLSFRAALATITSLVISMIFGKKIIKFLKRKQIGETVRDLGLEGQKEKEGTPTMGGLIIILSIVIPTLLFARLENVYVIIMLITTIWLGLIGFLDDYIKVFKKDKHGLAGKFKVLGQITLGVFVGVMMCCHSDIVVKEHVSKDVYISTNVTQDKNMREDILENAYTESSKSLTTTIPFVKNNELNYGNMFGKQHSILAALFFIAIVIFIVVLISNSANLTDGIDGLATGTSAIVGGTLGIFAWISGNAIFANYLNIMLIPDVGEMSIFIAAFTGACIGFLWYNSYPAQVFMGDTGSLTIGGIIAVFAILIRKELLLPLLCGVFLIESLSVVLQVSYFKYTKKRTGVGKRLFLMSPLHHHYQKKNYHEAKIVTCFIIVEVILAVFTIITLKLR